MSRCIGLLFFVVVLCFQAKAEVLTTTPTNGSEAIYSSPAVAEIDGNSGDGAEIAVAGADGVLYAFHSDGSLIWSATIPTSTCLNPAAKNSVYSSPAVGVLRPHEIPTVVIGYGGLGGGVCDGGVAAFRGSDGALLWNFDLVKFAKKRHFAERFHSVFSTPALADVDGDGKLEIGFGSFDRNIYLLNSDGSVRWYYQAADTVWSSPTFYDVNGDGKKEMIIGTDISGNSKIRPAIKNGGFLYALYTKPHKGLLINFRSKGSYAWQDSFEQVIQSSPVVADVLASNPGPEIIVATGCFFPQGNNNKAGKWIKIIRPRDGKVLQTLPTSGCSSSSVAVADIDHDGIFEIFALTNGSTSIGGDGASRLSAWKAENTTPLWSIIPRDRGGNDSMGGNFQSPAIGDLNGDGALEVVISNGSNVGIYAANDGSPITCQERSCDNGLALGTGGQLKSTPAIADLNGDSFPEIIVGGRSRSSNNGALFIWGDFSSLPTSPFAGDRAFAIPWGMHRGSAMRNGLK
jgi:hypothetical protein